MNRKHLPIFVAVALSGLAIGLAQDATPAPAASPSPAQGPGPQGKFEGNRRMMRERFLESLPPEVRQRFEAARNKAMEDPKIKALREAADKSNMELFKAVREKMLEIDPGLAELIKKREEGNNGPRPGGQPNGQRPPAPQADAQGATVPQGDSPNSPQPKREGGRPPGMGPNSPGFASLTDAEREKLMAAREKAKSDPAVVAADKKKDAANSPDDRMKAVEEYRNAMHEAILKIDPSLAPVLEKLAAARPPAPPKPANSAPPAPAKTGSSDEMMTPTK